MPTVFICLILPPDDPKFVCGLCAESAKQAQTVLTGVNGDYKPIAIISILYRGKRT